MDPGPSDEDDDVVSSNLVMSDRRVPRRVRRDRAICGPVDLESPLFNRPGIGCATRLMQEGAAFLGVHAQRHAPSPALTRGPGQDQKDDRERRLELLIRRLPRRLRDAVRWLRQPAARRLRMPVGLLSSIRTCRAEPVPDPRRHRKHLHAHLICSAAPMTV